MLTLILKTNPSENFEGDRRKREDIILKMEDINIH